MSKVTDNVSRYIKKTGMSIAKLSKGTGIPYSALYDSLLSGIRERELRDCEFLALCEFLGKDPMDFADKRIG